MTKPYYIIGVTYHPFLTINYLIEEVHEKADNGYEYDTITTSTRVMRAKRFDKMEDATALINKLKALQLFAQTDFTIITKNAR